MTCEKKPRFTFTTENDMNWFRNETYYFCLFVIHPFHPIMNSIGSSTNSNRQSIVTDNSKLSLCSFIKDLPLLNKLIYNNFHKLCIEKLLVGLTCSQTIYFSKLKLQLFSVSSEKSLQKFSYLSIPDNPCLFRIIRISCVSQVTTINFY